MGRLRHLFQSFDASEQVSTTTKTDTAAIGIHVRFLALSPATAPPLVTFPMYQSTAGRDREAPSPLA